MAKNTSMQKGWNGKGINGFGAYEVREACRRVLWLNEKNAQRVSQNGLVHSRDEKLGGRLHKVNCEMS